MNAWGSTRASGVLLHLSSLPGGHGIGDLGKAAHRFVDFLHGARQRYWQMLPVHPVGAGDSPYSALSAFAGNPLFVDLTDLVGLALLEESELRGRLPRAQVDFAKVRAYKSRLLRRAFDRFRARPSRFANSLEKLRQEANKVWLSDYALFMALRDAHGTGTWTRWPAEQRARQKAALTHARRALSEQVAYYEFEQWLFARQWKRLKRYAAERGVALIGDVPIFVAHDSADVWAGQHNFQLDRAGEPRFVSGVPPDYFSADGQRWGTPLYDWKQLKRSGYAFWVERFRTTLSRFDAVRLDHFIGFTRAWHVPASAETAREGRWRRGPGRDLFVCVQRALGGLPFIAEDLGSMTPAVAALRDGLGLPGMRVVQFGFDSDEHNQFLPHNYPRQVVAYTGTHDNDTTLGFLRDPAHRSEQRAVRRYLGAAADASDAALCDGLVERLFQSAADLCVVPMQDLLRLGSEARMNTPGRAEGAWGFRLPGSALRSEVCQRLRHLTQRTGRAG